MRSVAIITFLVAAFFSGCSRNEEIPQEQPIPVNIEILLDLSDRVLLENQAKNDIELIKTVFTEYAKIVRQTNLIVNSKDRFRVAIAPQKNISYDPISYMNILYLDMGAIPMSLKRDSLESFEKHLGSKLESLYSECIKGKTRKEDFYGCDLWKYFNEQLPSDLDSGSTNELIILTDGYFDFEDNPNVIHHGNRSTSTGVISKLRKMADPLDEFSKGNFGLIKPDKDYDHLNVAVMEMNPKSDNLIEPELLKVIWAKWMHEMGINNFIPTLKGSLPKSKSQLIDFLNKLNH
jgi:hypothetical protein